MTLLAPHHDVALDIVLRPMHGTDAARLARFHATLSPDTTRWRFFIVHPELSALELDRFTHVDHVAREAVVATIGGEIVGVGRYDREPAGTVAEVAFVVGDGWQRRGIAGALFHTLADHARAAGITRFHAVTLPDNQRMLRVFRRMGLPMTTAYDDGTVHVDIDLGPTTMSA